MEKYRVIDADTHFSEPLELWTDYLESAYRWAAPKKMVDNQGRLRRVLAGELLHHTPYAPKSTPMEKLRGSYDPAARLADMDRVGVDSTVIFPTWGLFFFSLKNAEVCAALCRAYNNWASDFIKANPKRLCAPALVPQMNIPLAIAEARRGLDTLGLKGVFMRPNVIEGRTLDHPAYEPLWELLEEYEAPLILHEGTTEDLNQAGLDRYDNFMFRHMISHPHEQQRRYSA